jgi:hypothetical protein
MSSDFRATYLELPTGGSSSDDNPPPADQPTRVQGWVLERVVEGERINAADPSYRRANELITDVMGEQYTGSHRNPEHQVVLNQTRKAINTHASVLTDIRPLWEWRTENPAFKRHANAYNKRLVLWWLQTFADMELADAVRYSSAIGSGDCIFEYDRFFNGGDMRLMPRDWRDTLPIRPERSRSIQDWQGVIFREAHTPSKLRMTYPGRIPSDLTTSGKFPGSFTRFQRIVHPERITSTLDGLGGKNPNRPYDAVAVQPELTLYRVFVRDYSINKRDQRILMGPPGANWGYFVEPGQPLYPRGRCIVTVEGIPTPLYDGPNPYWHGKWPGARLTLQRWPWLFTGMPLTFDMRSLQKIINTVLNDFLQTFSQWVNRGSIWGKNAPDNLYQRFDPTKKNWKVKVNTLVGTGFQMQDGPNLPPWSFQFFTLLLQKWDELSGTANLQQLLQLRQAPSAETLERFWEAMTPEIRMESRQIEAFLRDLAQMFIFNSAQFDSRERRVILLGEEGILPEDDDADPGTLVPGMTPGDAGYDPNLDSSLPRYARAQYYMRQFGFLVAPWSILAVHAQERKMMYLQLSRQGYMDFWTLGEMLEIPNLGDPPMLPLPKQDLTPEEISKLPADPQTGQPQVPLEVRRPTTVTERLMAQSQMGIGQTVSPAGRKASGQEPPQLEQKSDGSTTVTES